MAGEKRSATQAVDLALKESAIILDIEGTTSSISFVQDTLFPYVREFLKKHVDEKWNDEEFKADFSKLKEQAKEDEKQKVDGFIPIKEGTEHETKESIVQYVLWQMNNDRKTDALKQLQGHIWKAAYKPIKGHVYDDVPKAFEEWTNNGKKLYIYSSGSVEAQKLLFENSIHGNLLKYISGHFDTNIGSKQDIESYKNIFKSIGLESSDILFLTDVIKEAEAAKGAGLSTIIVIRKENAELSTLEKGSFKTIESFSELTFQTSSKRQKVEDANNITEKKDSNSLEGKLAFSEFGNEPMDTTDNLKTPIKEIKNDSQIEVKLDNVTEEKKVLKELEKTIENENKLVQEAISEEKTVTDMKMESDKSKEIVEKDINKRVEKTETEIFKDKSKIDIFIVDNKSAEIENKLYDTEHKSAKLEKVTEKTLEEINIVIKNKIEDSTTKENILEKEKMCETVMVKVIESMIEKSTEIPIKKITEKIVQTVTEEISEKAVEEITDKTLEVTKIEEEPELEEKQANTVEKKSTENIKENGEAKIFKSIENKSDESENKENVQRIEEAAKIETKIETDIEKVNELHDNKELENAGKDKIIDNEKEADNKVNLEDEVPKDVESTKLNGTTTNSDSIKNVIDEKLHSNGVSKESEKTKANRDAEESTKMKKAVADGAGEPDVINSPVLTAMS
ncbi:PREDICTED: enolase-phosphatase E1-like [Ceratosolen solmsi marchali]|uniref:Enolase-phosphatase E1 n=1 Tax=Ceratosolen solmsi marchali TaxID=326594 RepID=A0AAJ6YMW0_9HYME|nr:PREDICTED: enolase-phosphatase E1-like [Ceratosolen solmsi marchali]